VADRTLPRRYSYKLDRLQPTREQKHMSLVDLALSSGVGTGRLRQFERAEANARRMTVHKLATALGVEPAELMEGEKG
jgi:transcriptional regulator with XRE-family HTH domain